MQVMHDPLILASSSPQRKTLLDGLGIAFVVIPSHVNEAACTIADPKKRAQILAREKAQDVAAMHRGRYVLGCDTLVVAPDQSLLEKPVDRKDAAHMLRLQSGGSSIVHSALVLIEPDGIVNEGISSSEVRFKKLSDEEIEWWMNTGLWQNRSGAFQIDGPGQLMIEEIHGDWTGIVGLPVFLLGKLMKEAGFPKISSSS